MEAKADRFSSACRTREQTAVVVEPFYASDYFDQIYEYAVALIKNGKAYVCDLTPEETDAYRRDGKESRRSATAASRRTSTFSRG